MNLDESNIWYLLDYFTNNERVQEYISQKIKSEEYEDCYNKVIAAREKYELDKKLEKVKKIESKDIKEQSEQVIFSVKQASEYFRLSKIANLHIKPLILYYGMISLSKSLMDSNFTFEKIKPHHGLTGGNNYSKCFILKRGFFPRFSSCNSYVREYSNDLNINNYDNILNQIHQNNGIEILDLIFHLENYLKISKPEKWYGLREIFKEMYNSEREKGIKEINIKTLDPISSYLILMYLLSNIVRYRPVDWIKIISGNDKKFLKLDWLLKPLIDDAIISYPKLILNEFKKYPLH